MVPSKEQDWEARVRAVWDSAADSSEEVVVQEIALLQPNVSENDAAALFERASARDFDGLEAEAEPLYRLALDAGVTGERRSQAVIQLASMLRNVGRADEAVAMLTHEIDASPDDGLDDARAAFLALALHNGSAPTSTRDSADRPRWAPSGL